MPFRNERQQARLIKVLLKMAQMGHLWECSDLGHCGPSEEAVNELRTEDFESQLSSGQRALLRIAFDLWNRSGQATLSDVVEKLDPKITHAFSELLMSMSSDDPNDLELWEREWTKYDPSTDFFN